jgi:hypothetical protein
VQQADVRIDHRIVTCRFYRVSSNKGHRSVLKPVRDAGANMVPQLRDEELCGAEIRREFNAKGWSYISDEILNRRIVQS